MEISRRALLLAAAAGGAKPIDTHIHLFDPERFPYHANAAYRPPAETLEKYAAFAAQAYSHVVIVHPEPYQDDHSYLEYCFRNEPRKGFFKGTCLFDALDPKTPGRMAELIRKWPDRIVALRVHATEKQTSSSGPIRDRDLSDPRMAETWAAAHRLGLAIQMHMIPMWAPAVAKLIQRTPGVRVVIDHLCRYGQGTEQEYAEVLKLKAYMKFSGLSYSSKQPAPHADLQPLARRIHAAFGADRIIWGGLGMNAAAHGVQSQAFATIWSFLSAGEQEKIRRENAAKLYRIGG
jgi:predicted TIM-barrel fold metal-dependent hydrolase